MLEFSGRLRRKWNRGLPFIGLHLETQLLPRAHNREPLLVKQLFDPQHTFHIAPAVHALPGAALHWLQLRKLAFPKAQHVCGQAAQRSHFPNAEIQLIRDENLILLVFMILARAFFSLTHVLLRLHRLPGPGSPQL